MADTLNRRETVRESCRKEGGERGRSAWRIKRRRRKRSVNYRPLRQRKAEKRT